MQSNAIRPGIFDWVNQVADAGANIIIAGEKGRGKTYLMETLIKNVLTFQNSEKTLLSLKRFPAFDIPSTLTVAMAPVRHNDSPLAALRMNQGRLFLDEAEDGETLENIFLFHDISATEGGLGQYICTLKTETTIEERIIELSSGMSGDDVCSELFETIDFVIYMMPQKSCQEGYPSSAISSVKEVIVDADGNVGERTIWEYNHVEEDVYYQVNTLSRRRREKFFCS